MKAQNMEWHADEHDRLCLRDRDGNHRAGCSLIPATPTQPASWSWAAFPRGYRRGQDDQAVIGGFAASGFRAMAEAEEAVARLDVPLPPIVAQHPLDWTWTCHVCGDERPNAQISVYTRDISASMGLPEGSAQFNVRYCNDRPECIAGAPSVALNAKEPKHPARSRK